MPRKLELPNPLIVFQYEWVLANQAVLPLAQILEQLNIPLLTEEVFNDRVTKLCLNSGDPTKVKEIGVDGEVNFNPMTREVFTISKAENQVIKDEEAAEQVIGDLVRDAVL